uniref:Uncharacterized protein n=1 Tax=Arundo donax TaxID=35708 RepID=A0A0A9U0F5_ARUDO
MPWACLHSAAAQQCRHAPMHRGRRPWRSDAWRGSGCPVGRCLASLRSPPLPPLIALAPIYLLRQPEVKEKAAVSLLLHRDERIFVRSVEVSSGFQRISLDLFDDSDGSIGNTMVARRVRGSGRRTDLVDVGGGCSSRPLSIVVPQWEGGGQICCSCPRERVFGV